MLHDKTELEIRIEALKKLNVDFERFDNSTGGTEIRIENPVFMPNCSCISYFFQNGRHELFLSTSKCNELKKIN